jgi:integrase
MASLGRYPEVGLAEARERLVAAHLLMQACSAIMDHAVEEELVERNPLIGLARNIARPEPKEKRPLAPKEIADFLTRVGESGMSRTTAIHLNLLLIFWCRPGELRRAEWSEFDLASSWWRIPGEKMKMRLPHSVPLSIAALKLLRELKSTTGRSRWLFPNVRRPHECMRDARPGVSMVTVSIARRVTSFDAGYSGP